ncbi:MAG: hypothetical protein AAF378_24765 [Cyanobacteria bacterium P01_A01_bin.84]
MIILKYFAVWLLIIFLCLGFAKQSLAASFQGLGNILNQGLSSEAFDVSGDGSIVVGLKSYINGREPFVWTKDNEISSLNVIEKNIFVNPSVNISIIPFTEIFKNVPIEG